MRYIQEVIWDSTSLSIGTNISKVFDVRMCYAGSVQFSYPSNTLGGTFKVQASVDNTSWIDVPETTCSLGQDTDTILLNMGEIYYPYVRVSLEISETLVVSCDLFMKGGT